MTIVDGVQHWGWLKLQMGDDIVYISVFGPEMSVMDKIIHGVDSDVLGRTWVMEKNSNTEYTSIYFEKPCRDAATLFHVVAHELQHIRHLVTGYYYAWKKEWGKPTADAYSEYLAYRWNYQHLYITDPMLLDAWNLMQYYIDRWHKLKRLRIV